MTDTELLNTVRELIKFEGYVQHIYLDTKGLPTVGVGNLIKTIQDAFKVPFSVKEDFNAASQDEIRRDYDKVCRIKPGLKASRYGLVCRCYVTEANIEALCVKRLKDEFLPGLYGIFPDFDEFPNPAREALIDLAYNLGVGGLRKFRQLRKSIKEGDWERASRCCKRKTSTDRRNKWTKNKFLESYNLLRKEIKKEIKE